MSSISVKGIVVGALFDIIVTFVTSIALVLGFAASAESIQPETFDQMYDDQSFYVVGTFGGCLVSIVAGYLAARIAGRGELINGALATTISTIILIPLMLIGDSGDSGAFSAPDVILLAITPLLGLFGGYLRMRQVG